MRLQKRKTRKTDGDEFSQYVVVIPLEHIEELGWKVGQELEPEVDGKNLVISPKVLGKD